MKFTRSLLSSALLLATTQVFATQLVPYGSGVYFYSWTANEYCSTDTSINPTGSCPEKWTDTVKNINAQLPTDPTTGAITADKAQIKYIYLDSIQFNFSHADAPLSQSIFKVGGCGDTADITYCVNSGGLTYASPNNQNGPDAVKQLATELGMPASTYYIMPMISDARDKGIMNMSSGQLQSLAFSLACIVNPSASVPNPWLSNLDQSPFTGGPTSCKDVFMGSMTNYSAQNISGLAFDVENPDFSGRHYIQANGTLGPVDQNSASDFYSTLQQSIGAMTPAKYIMFSRGPGGLLETNDGQQAGTVLSPTTGLPISLPTFGEILGGNPNGMSYTPAVTTGLNQNPGPKFIFSPQIYDLCDGLGNTTTSWACPLAAPIDPGMDYQNGANSVATPAIDAVKGSENWGKQNAASKSGALRGPVAGAYYNNYLFLQAIPNSPMPGSTSTLLSPNSTPLNLSWVLFFPDGNPQDKYYSLYNNPLNDVTVQAMSMPYLFKSELEGKSFMPVITVSGVTSGVISTTQYPLSSMTNTNPISPPDVPVQLTISGGASSQIWEHVNLYNVDAGLITPNSTLPNTITPTTSGATIDYYRYPTQFDTTGKYEQPDLFPNPDYITDVNNGDSVITQYYSIPFTPSMIYTNKQFCQYENPNGSSGGTIPNCISYKNPYGETVAAYADSFFTTLQYALANDSAAASTQTSAPFYGVAMYPFTPYGYFDQACTASATNLNPCKAGFFPEAPDGLVNGQKPQTSFWKIYVGKFGNQWTGASTGTIPTAQANGGTTPFAPASETLITLPAGYYSNSGGTATVNFNVSTYPAGTTTDSNINSYRARLVDATGMVVASSDQGGSCSTTSCTITNAPGGNYTLEVQALASNGGVITEVDAAAMSPGAPPVPSSQAAITIQNATYVSPTSYTITWILNCSGTTPPKNLSSSISTAAVTGPGPRTSLSMVSGTEKTCGASSTETFSTYGGYNVAVGSQVSVFLVDDQFQALTTPQTAPLTTGN